MSQEQELVTIAEFENSFEAELAKLTLDNAGVKSVILGQDLTANLTYNPAIFHIELQVCVGDAERAKQVLAETNQQDGQ